MSLPAIQIGWMALVQAPLAVISIILCVGIYMGIAKVLLMGVGFLDGADLASVPEYGFLYHG